jgi:hypothetical protein
MPTALLAAGTRSGSGRSSKALLARPRLEDGARRERIPHRVCGRRCRLVASAANPHPNHQTKPNPAPLAAPIRSLQDPDRQLPATPGCGLHIHAAGAGRGPVLSGHLRADSG